MAITKTIIITPLLMHDLKTLEQQCNSNEKTQSYIIVKESRSKPSTFWKFYIKKEMGN